MNEREYFPADTRALHDLPIQRMHEALSPSMYFNLSHHRICFRISRRSIRPYDPFYRIVWWNLDDNLRVVQLPFAFAIRQRAWLACVSRVVAIAEVGWQCGSYPPSGHRETRRGASEIHRLSSLP